MMPSIRRLLTQLRVKITLPYTFLALFIAFASAYLVTRLLVGLLEDRFQTVLLDAGYKVADEVVRVEQEQLAVLRAIVYTEGLAEAVAVRNTQDVGLLTSPLAVNAQVDCVDILDSRGQPIFAMRRRPQGSATDYEIQAGAGYAEWEIVRRVLNGEIDEWGDKYAYLIESDWGWVFYTSGPIKVEGRVVGVALVGSYLDTLALRLDNAALSRVTLYTRDHSPLATTLAPNNLAALALSEQDMQTYLGLQDDAVFRRAIEINQRDYAEIFGAFEVRHGRDIGVFSVSLPLSFVTNASHPTRRALVLLFALATALVLLVGYGVANAIVRRVRKLTLAAQQVAGGNLDVQVGIRGCDEIADLAQDFDTMVKQLQEGQLYRDLLGFTASPAVAERLRAAQQDGSLRLQGQIKIATILFVDIRGFTRLAENEGPTEIIELLNEYLGGVATLVKRHHGVVNKFVGDAALAFFGILPQVYAADYSARNALLTALSITEYVCLLNKLRAKKGQAFIRVGVGVNTGPVVAGLLGSKERFEYTVLGDVVNVAQRLSSMNKVFSHYDVFMGPDTRQLLGNGFESRLECLGEHVLQGRLAPIKFYAII